ncbi:hypothetical protein GCM10011519_27650 [Marmoricola endophyticus]|uniref:Metallophosphoesterase n=1 Tax=Marmoricola endophyticus TaxID=2040280 RepID=A0A917F5L1_9ACTN|nr:metallophosphoesterase [Marmoricola endophyticus]GGF52112.1 hypothetical protein GCM10011519_27650 [Marmoricola endophyticus]
MSAPHPVVVRRLLHVAGGALVWLVVAAGVALLLFLNTSRSTVLASHDAVVRPTLDGRATIHLGPFLPDLRDSTGSRVGADITLGKTEASSLQELVQRYGFIASDPEPQLAKARSAITDVAWQSVGLGAVAGLVPLGLWLLLGRRRRAEVVRHLPTPRGAVLVVGTLVVVVAAGVLVREPWRADAPTVGGGQTWRPLAALAPGVDLPSETRGIEVRMDLATAGTKQLIASALDTYDRSKRFYADAREAAEDLDGLHEPAEDQSVVLEVSDRHDNVGMDAVARAVADRGGASDVIDAGDDTSTGSQWEAFSLDSLDRAFDTPDGIEHRWSIAGNHDHGDFVTSYLADLGWTHLDGKVVDGPAGTPMYGIDDPRSSGLGPSREAVGISFDEQREQIADEVCRADEEGERVRTLVVHDANSGEEALARGCVDLVLAGHLHVQVGPTRVVGSNGSVGYSYTNGTTGGAAYAIAVGSKLRREAGMTLVTYDDERPVGVQPVALRTDGVFVVGDYTALDYSAGADEPAAGASTSPSPSSSPSS